MKTTATVLTVFSLLCLLPRLTPAALSPTPVCGCVGDTQTSARGDTITIRNIGIEYFNYINTVQEVCQ